MRARDLNRRVRIEKPVASTDYDGAGQATWALVAEVWAQVQDVLPSRSERLADGMNTTTGPARVRMRYRNDVTASMRLVMGDRVMQIVSKPAELGRREGLEMMAEDYSPAGGG